MYINSKNRMKQPLTAGLGVPILESEEVSGIW